MVTVFDGDRQIDCSVEEYRELFGDAVSNPKPKKVRGPYKKKKDVESK